MSIVEWFEGVIIEGEGKRGSFDRKAEIDTDNLNWDIGEKNYGWK